MKPRKPIEPTKKEVFGEVVVLEKLKAQSQARVNYLPGGSWGEDCGACLNCEYCSDREDRDGEDNIENHYPVRLTLREILKAVPEGVNPEDVFVVVSASDDYIVSKLVQKKKVLAYEKEDLRFQKEYSKYQQDLKYYEHQMKYYQEWLQKELDLSKKD